MSADLTPAAAASAAAIAATEFLRAGFGIPPDALGCGLAGAYIGLHFVREEMTAGRALRLMVAMGLGAAVVGNYFGPKDAPARELVALIAGIVFVPGARILIERCGELVNMLFDLAKRIRS